MAGASGWSRRFDDPIVLPDGKKLATLKDAIEHLGGTVPKSDHDHPEGADCRHLPDQRRRGRDLIMHARIATLQASNRHVERVFNADRKEHHWGKRKLKRDQ